VAHRPHKPEPVRVYRGVSGAVARAIDAVLSPLAPKLVLSRQRARIESAAMLAYDMASRKRTRRTQRSSSADQDLLADLPEMRKNSRAMVRDDSAASAMVRVLEDNVVGTGLRPQVMVDRRLSGLSDAEADRWNEDAEAFFAAWQDSQDATEVDDFYAMQRLVLRSLVVDGEFVLHRTNVEGRQVGTAWEMVDPDRLVDPQDTGGLDVRAGIELGPRHNPIAYWITPRHPDEIGLPYGKVRQENLPKRWARTAGGQLSILHGFRRDRVGQTRGVPFFAPSFGLVEAMNDMLETELQAARAASKFCAFIKQTIDSAGLGIEQDPNGEWHEKLESATIRYLNPGEELVNYTPNRPGNNFEPFVVRVLRSICASLNLPYELVLKDFGGMNYSSARIALLEARRGFEVLQQLIIAKFCQPVFSAAIFDGVVSGALKTPNGFRQNPKLFTRAYWQPPAWGWVDPVKEIDASRAAIENSLSTPQAEAARQGGDAESNLEQRARFLRRAAEVEKAYGLQEGRLTQTAQQQVQQAAAAAAGAGAGKAEPDDDDEEPEA